MQELGDSCMDFLLELAIAMGLSHCKAERALAGVVLTAGSCRDLLKVKAPGYLILS